MNNEMNNEMKNLKIIMINGGSLEVQEILDHMEKSSFLPEKLSLFSHGPRQGEIHDSILGPLVIGRLEDIPEEGYDVAVLLEPVPDIKWLTRVLVKGNINFLDASGSLAGKPQIPLLHPDFWDTDAPFPLVATVPSPEGMILGTVCRAVESLSPVRSVFLSILSGASRAGSKRGLDELFDQTRSIMGFEEMVIENLPRQLAFNAFPHGDSAQINTRVKNELAMALSGDLPEFDMTINWGSFFVGMLGTVWVRTDSAVKIPAFLKALASTSYFEFPDESPAILDVVGSDKIFLTEIRHFSEGDQGLTLRFAMDNLRKGLSINLIKVLEFLK